MTLYRYSPAAVETESLIDSPEIYADPETNYAVLDREIGEEQLLEELKRIQGVGNGKLIRSAARTVICDFLSRPEVEIEDAVFSTVDGTIETDSIKPLVDDISMTTIKKMTFTVETTTVKYRANTFEVPINRRDVLTRTVFPGMFGPSEDRVS